LQAQKGIKDITGDKIPTQEQVIQQLKKKPISPEKPVDMITQLTRQREQQQQAQREAISKTPIGKAIINPIAGFGAGVLKGAGVSGLARVSGLPGTAETGRIVEEEIARSPISGTIGTVAGAILPGGAASKVAGKVLAPVLKKAGFLTRDPRVIERKKAGLKKARKRSQYSKR
jgi:hypothetical protein